MEYYDRKNRSFDALICLNASLPDIEYFEKFQYEKLIAADGAGAKIFKKNIYPDFIIGDFDSLERSAIPDDFNVKAFIVDQSQDYNDFEKILRFCIEKNYTNLLIFGIHGGELEHTLNNISVFKKFANKINMTIFDENRYGILIDNYLRLPAKINEIISLIPIPTARVTSKNLVWELDNETLELGIREGARNQAKSNEIEIYVHEGALLLFFDFEY